MAEPNPGYQAVEGSPDQLPRGEATRLNTETDVVAPEPIELAAPSAEADTGVSEMAAPVPVEEEELIGADDMADAADFNPEGYVPIDEDEAYITGPTMRPGEDQAAGAQYPAPLSPRVRASLSALQAAASEPGADPTLQALIRLLLLEVD